MNAGSSRKDCLAFLLLCVERVVVLDWLPDGGVGLPVMISPVSPPPPPPPPPAARAGTAAGATKSARESATGAMNPSTGLVMPHSCFCERPSCSRKPRLVGQIPGHSSLFGVARRPCL